MNSFADIEASAEVLAASEDLGAQRVGRRLEAWLVGNPGSLETALLDVDDETHRARRDIGRRVRAALLRPLATPLDGNPVPGAATGGLQNLQVPRSQSVLTRNDLGAGRAAPKARTMPSPIRAES